MDLYKRSKFTGLYTKCIQERTWHRTRNSKPSPTLSGARRTGGVRTGRTEAGNASYETFGEDKAAAEAYAAKLNDRAKAKRLGELDAITKEEANDLRWAIQKLAHYGTTVKEAAEWFVKTKFPEKGNKTVREVGEIYLKHRANEIKSNTFENYETKIERFSSHFEEKLINEVTTADCEKILRGSR